MNDLSYCRYWEYQPRRKTNASLKFNQSDNDFDLYDHNEQFEGLRTLVDHCEMYSEKCKEENDLKSFTQTFLKEVRDYRVFDKAIV